jgi:hypothetical protein
VLLASVAEGEAHAARMARIAKKSGGRLLWPADDDAGTDERMAVAG